MDQIKLHNEIDALKLKNPADIKPKMVADLILKNDDAHQYFFATVDERWVDWLWKNNFLDAIKNKADDPSGHRYRMPELNYLVRISDKDPLKVADIILNEDVADSVDKFNPEVVDQFTYICSALPAEQLARIVPKILKNKWVYLMRDFRHSEFSYEKMLKTLFEAKDYGSLLILSEALLMVQPEEEMEKSKFSKDNPFYLEDLCQTNIFNYLTEIGEQYTEKALQLSTKILSEIVLLGGEVDGSEKEVVFPFEEHYYLYDVDLFTLSVGQGNRLSFRNDIHDLMAVVKITLSRLIEKKCSEADFVQKIYKKYVDALPKSRLIWRLQLFSLSLCPEVLKAELKAALFRLFDVKRYHEIMSGPEYEKTLQKTFSTLSETDQLEYVDKTLEYFGRDFEDKKEQSWYRRDGSKILSMIESEINEPKKIEATKKGFEFYSDYQPEPDIGRSRGGSVHPRGAITQEEFSNLEIKDIAKQLRDDWIPEKLNKQNKEDDFLNPLNAEGVGEQLRSDIPKRLSDYIENAKLFFERDVLDQHYTYSFLRGIQEALRVKETNLSAINWEKLFSFCIAINKSDQGEPFSIERRRDRDTFGAWLSGWRNVYSVMADVFEELLKERSDDLNINFSKYRDQIFEVISYLLRYPDPTPAGEKIETATSKTQSSGDSKYLVSDPMHLAINSVRGRAFQAFVFFIYQDGNNFSKEKKIKISEDVKELYEEVLKNEDTRALMFMFGHYLPSFYFRDKEWIRGLLPQIFPVEPEKHYFYVASWEGCLANNLYEEMFFDPAIQKLYERGLKLDNTDYPDQQHSKDPNEGIAIHLAIAFMHFDKFSFEHPLLTIFWKDASRVKGHSEFVSFIGRSLVSGDNMKLNKLMEENPKIKDKLKGFWDWMLKNYKDAEPFNEFGFWINTEKGVFDSKWLAEHIKQTLEKTNGVLDWDLGLMQSIVQLSKDAPEDALAITRLYLLTGGVGAVNRRALFHIDREWLEALKILYRNSGKEIKKETYDLINDLILNGGSVFWGLKKVFSEEGQTTVE